MGRVGLTGRRYEWVRSHVKFATVLAMFLAPVGLVAARPRAEAPRFYPAPTILELEAFAQSHPKRVLPGGGELP